MSSRLTFYPLLMMNLLQRLWKKEREQFDRFGTDAQRLILVNLVYALAYPFIIYYSSAFINRETGNPELVIYYQWGWFAGLTMGFFCNGLLLKKIDIRYLFWGGMVTSILALFMLIYLGTGLDQIPTLVGFGILVGLGSGFYWSNRNFLSFLTTTDDNRNFFTGLEQFILIGGNAVSNALLGLAFFLGETNNWYTPSSVYYWSSLLVLIIVLLTGRLILTSNFKSPEIKRFTYSKFQPFWKKQRMLTFLIGMLESGFMVIPVLLILTLLGGEASFGAIESVSAIVSVIAIYFIGKHSTPEQRTGIMLAGVICISIGAVSVSLIYSFVGIAILKICQVFADPLVHSSFRATLFTSTERASAMEKRDSYTYMMDNEYFMNSGRILGGGVFLLLFYYGSQEIALRYSLIILASSQFASVWITKNLSTGESRGVETKEEVQLEG